LPVWQVAYWFAPSLELCNECSGRWSLSCRAAQAATLGIYAGVLVLLGLINTVTVRALGMVGEISGMLPAQINNRLAAFPFRFLAPAVAGCAADVTLNSCLPGHICSKSASVVALTACRSARVCAFDGSV
jgi:hypothetical protein